MLASTPRFSLVSVEPFSRSTSVRLPQPENALSPTLATLFGIVMLANLPQLSNA